jgi:4-aminobutyrate aminotransferase
VADWNLNSEAVFKRDENAIGSVFKIRFYPLVVDRANGVTLTDVDGRNYLDFNAGWAVANTGYGHPEVLKAIKEQLEKASFASTITHLNEVTVKLAEKLAKITPGDFPKKVWFGLSGSDANDLIFKILPKAAGRPRIMSFLGAYHGQTMGSASLSGHKAHTRFPSFANVTKIPYAYCYRCPFSLSYPKCGIYCANDFIEDYALKTMADPADLAGLIVEPIQSDGGDVVPPRGYLEELKKFADKYDMLFAVDEVKIGFGRTGKMFGVQQSSVIPDIVVVGKPIASGMPLSAVVCKGEILDSLAGTHLVTTGGNPVSCAAGLATIDVIEKERLADNAAKVGEYMKRRFSELAATHDLIGDVRGAGLIVGVELVRNRETKEPASRETAKLCYQAWKNGLVTAYVGLTSNVMEMTPPLVLTIDQAEEGIQIFERSLSQVEAGKVPDSEVAPFAGW